MNNHTLTKFTKFFLDFMFFSGIIITLTVPLIFRFARTYYPNIDRYYIPMCIIFMICGCLALVIIFHLRKMFKTVLENDCFVNENVISLNRMGYASFLISLANIIRLCFVITPATLILILVFFIAGLFSLVLAQVFGKAVEYKLENDFTI